MTARVTTRIALTPTLVEDFRRDGFVVVPDLLRADERPPVRRGRRRRRGPAQPARDATLAEKSRYEQSFTQCQNLWEDCPDVRPLTFHSADRRDGGPPARRRRRPALARPGALQGAGRPRDRPAPGPALLAHRRDRHHHGVDPFRRVDARKRRHGLPPREPPARRCASSSTSSPARGEDPLRRRELQGMQPVFVEVPPGSVAFHHGLTFHLARPNTHRYGPSGAHRDLFRGRVDPGRRSLPPSLGRAGRDRDGSRDRERRDAHRVAPAGRRPARPADGADRMTDGADRRAAGVVGRSGASSASPASPHRRRAGHARPGDRGSCASPRWPSRSA